mmetsp:Transcript_34962/g.75761  ORF Transcript_34962/g.75761 Transcript_34962/m.75761 type:complete len:811 (+) Transcript_34962:222-2654(+)
MDTSREKHDVSSVSSSASPDTTCTSSTPTSGRPTSSSAGGSSSLLRVDEDVGSSSSASASAATATGATSATGEISNSVPPPDHQPSLKGMVQADDDDDDDDDGRSTQTSLASTLPSASSSSTATSRTPSSRLRDKISADLRTQTSSASASSSAATSRTPSSRLRDKISADIKDQGEGKRAEEESSADDENNLEKKVKAASEEVASDADAMEAVPPSFTSTRGNSIPGRNIKGVQVSGAAASADHSQPGAHAVPGMLEDNSRSVEAHEISTATSAQVSRIGTPILVNEETKESEDTTYEVAAYAVEDDTELQRRLEEENQALRHQVQEINKAPVAMARVIRDESMKEPRGNRSPCQRKKVIIALIAFLFLCAIALGIAAGTGSFQKGGSASTTATSGTGSFASAPTLTPAPSFAPTYPLPTAPTTPKPTFYQECWTKSLADDGAANDTLGRRIAMHNDTILVGASREEDNDRGAAYVYVLSEDGTWRQQDKLIPQDSIASEFGRAVGLYGDTAVIGAQWDKVGDLFRGIGYVFERQGTAWKQSQMLRPDDWTRGDRVGSSVAIYSDTIVLGAEGDDGKRGAAYVFRRQRDNSWRQQQKLVVSEMKEKGRFGRDVDIGPERIIIGADGMNEVYIFSFNGTKWSQQAMLSAASGVNETKKKKFGYGVSIDQGNAIVGAYRDDLGVGSAYIFAQMLNGTWVQTAKLSPSDGKTGDEFGRQVLIKGDAAFIGSRHHDDNGPKSGSVYIFQKAGDSWQEKAKLKPSDGVEGDEFGNGIAISNDILAVSSFRDDDSGYDSGSFYSVKLSCLFDGRER